MRLRRRFWGVLWVAALLAGCVPQAVVTQPALRLHLSNEAGEPVDAEVTLHWWEYPHRRQRSVSAVSTDAGGTATFTETVATETMMPLMPHGIPAYNWTFCIEAAGYKTLIGTVRDVEPGDAIEVNLTLHPGESFPVCENFDQLPFHRGTPIDDLDVSGGSGDGSQVHGVYEVEEPHE
jgi:hypothetical protein